MSKKKMTWEDIANILAFFSLAAIVIVGVLGLFGANLGVIQNWAVLIKDIFITVLVAVMAYKFSSKKTKPWRITFWVLLVLAIMLSVFSNGAITSLWK